MLHRPLSYMTRFPGCPVSRGSDTILRVAPITIAVRRSESPNQWEQLELRLCGVLGIRKALCSTCSRQ